MKKAILQTSKSMLQKTSMLEIGVLEREERVGY